ncbi:MAG: hypothetical protein WAW52_03360 [Methanothrix sp.]
MIGCIHISTGVYSRLAPYRNFSPYVRDTWSRDYPFSLVLDRKLTAKDTFQIIMDHYEGTVYDLTTGMAAGRYGNTYHDDGPFDSHEAFDAGDINHGSWPRPASAIFCNTRPARVGLLGNSGGALSRRRASDIGGCGHAKSPATAAGAALHKVIMELADAGLRCHYDWLFSPKISSALTPTSFQTELFSS